MLRLPHHQEPWKHQRRRLSHRRHTFRGQSRLEYDRTPHHRTHHRHQTDHLRLHGQRRSHFGRPLSHTRHTLRTRHPDHTRHRTAGHSRHRHCPPQCRHNCHPACPPATQRHTDRRIRQYTHRPPCRLRHRIPTCRHEDQQRLAHEFQHTRHRIPFRRHTARHPAVRSSAARQISCIQRSARQPSGHTRPMGSRAAYRISCRRPARTTASAARHQRPRRLLPRSQSRCRRLRRHTAVCTLQPGHRL